MTALDIAYIMHVVFQFMHASRITHLHAVKRNFRYLWGIADHGLFFKHNSKMDLLVAFCDVDWVGCPDSCRSTFGFLVFLGSNLVT